MRVYAVRPVQRHSARAFRLPAQQRPRASRCVVLPFADIGSGAEQEHFVDRVTESLTTDLSRIRHAFVIARNTAFTYKGRPLDAKTIGRELKSAMPSGSASSVGQPDACRIQLIDAETGSHLWAERFDKPLADLFDMQDEIVARLANALNTQLIAAEARRSERAPTPDFLDLYFQGLAWLNKGLIPRTLRRRAAFRSRSHRRSRQCRGACWIGGCGRAGGRVFLCDRSSDGLRGSRSEVDQGAFLALDHAGAHLQLGIVYIWTKRAAQGITECKQALALDRNLASAHSLIGYGKLFVGRFEETEPHIAEALRLSPRDKMAYTWMFYAGLAKFGAGSYDQAVAWFRRVDRG